MPSGRGRRPDDRGDVPALEQRLLQTDEQVKKVGFESPAFQCTSNDPGTRWHRACGPQSRVTADTVFML
jgi:hypothetical protein